MMRMLLLRSKMGRVDDDEEHTERNEYCFGEREKEGDSKKKNALHRGIWGEECLHVT